MMTKSDHAFKMCIEHTKMDCICYEPLCDSLRFGRL